VVKKEIKETSLRLNNLKMVNFLDDFKKLLNSNIILKML